MNAARVLTPIGPSRPALPLTTSRSEFERSLTRVAALRHWRRAAVVIAVALITACGRREDTLLAKAKPVEECISYERALAGCFHRKVDLAAQPSLTPASDEDRRRVAALCTENLRRIQQTCR